MIQKLINELVERLLDWPTTLAGVLVCILTWMLVQNRIDATGYAAALGAAGGVTLLMSKSKKGQINE